MAHSNHQTHPVCPWWLTYSFDNPLRRLAHKPEELFKGRLQPGMRALDLGCGFGYFSLGMARLLTARESAPNAPPTPVLAVDLQEKMLRRVRKRAKKAGLEDVIELRQCAKDSLRIGPGQGDPPADFALAFWVAHEIPDQARAFKEMHEALKPGGRLYLAEPRLDVSHRYFEAEIGRVEDAGFRHEECPKVAFSLAAVFTRI